MPDAEDAPCRDCPAKVHLQHGPPCPDCHVTLCPECGPCECQPEIPFDFEDQR